MAVSPRRSAYLFALGGFLLLAAAASAPAAEVPEHSADLDNAIVREAKKHGVPVDLVRRVVMRESKYNPRARNHSFWGLMQISYPTARSMGFRGTPEQLLNPAVNLAYAVPYLANAFIIAGKREDAAIRLYASGYYATAKNRGLLGILRTADSTPLIAAPADQQLYAATAEPAAAPLEEQPQQQLAYAPEASAVAPAQAQIAAAAPPAPARSGATVTSDKNDGAHDIAMVTDKAGRLKPPKKWLHDGGNTVMARGEQPAEQIAALRIGDAPAPRHAKHSRKTTAFAALQAPTPGSAAQGGQAQAEQVQEAQAQAVQEQTAQGQYAAAAPQQPPYAGAEPAGYAPAPQAVADAGASAFADPAIRPEQRETKAKHVSRVSHAAKKHVPTTKLAKAQAGDLSPAQE